MLTKFLDRFRSPEHTDQDETNEVLALISAERERQRRKFGSQSRLPDGTKVPGDGENEQFAKTLCATKHARGIGTWRDIFIEEVAEACNADGKDLATELVQVAAVATAWVEAIRSRT